MGQKQSGSQTTTQTPDPLTQRWRQMVMNYGMGALGIGGQGPKLQPVPGLSPLTQQATGGYQSALNAGNLGLGALSGNQADINTFMNPYQSGVVNQLQNQYGIMSQNLANQNADAATQAHAFGGTRQAVAQGIAQGQLGIGMGQQMASLLDQGYNTAQQQALAAANLGMGAAGQLQNLGEYGRQVQMQKDPAMRQLTILQGLLSGMPYGMTQSTPLYTNPGAGALGGAAMGASIGSMIPGLGTGLGAGLGGLLGLF